MAENQRQRIKAYKAGYYEGSFNPISRAVHAFNLGLLLEETKTRRSYENAVLWHERAAILGYSTAASHLAQLFETGVRADEEVTDDFFYDKHTLVSQDSEAAGYWYLKAAESGFPDDFAKVSRLYLEGKLLIRNYEKAFLWMLKAACWCIGEHMATLCDYYVYGTGVEQSFYEAYVWALMARDKVRPKALAHYESELTKQETSQAQKEAEFRMSMGSSYEFSKELYNYMLERLKTPDPYAQDAAQPISPDEEPLHTEALSPDPDSTPDPGLPALLKDWKVAGVSSLTFHVNLREKNVRIVYGRKSKTLTNADFARLFTRYALPLIVDHHESQRSSKPPVDYASPSLARGVDLTLTRPNHKAVSDVNSRIRSVFGLGKKEQAFKWISANRHDTKTLKANIKIEVHY
ncbi:MAG TPA: tetratricopeptide repeat protein [Candidatus Syntrophosphaera sp.]|nr:tetratricopeptide repeat protein [Candidatus Syntrophosphaera sp.]